MKLKYFGTAAYEGFPAMGCECDACKRARRAGGKNLRSRTQAMVNDDLLLDFPADSVWHFMQYGIDYGRIKACLISHSHSDHLYPADIEAFGKGYCHNDRKAPLHFYAGESGYKLISAKTELERMQGRADCTLVKPFEKFSVGGYEILPLKASHEPATSPVLYRIGKEGKSLLFAHDTGAFCEETWKALEKAGRLDLVSLDSNGEMGVSDSCRHLAFDTAIEVFDGMKKRGIADEKTVMVANHFSHNCKKTYDDMLPYGEKYGVVISYDGLEIEF